ncbi:NUDIX domain-containing protein [Lachnospira multipara]|uniref:NUDIX domain-containing protein n=1 Tax=Lachnospira multipara TaxID=28051 RepID=UPI000411773A|nr:NUDIX hydrolase [Lachnospira multipara]
MTYLDSEQNKQFLGNGRENAKGESLETFLNNYDPTKYQSPCNTVDTLVFTYIEEDGHKKINRLLLIKRGNHPSIGMWALPGGFVDFKEDLKAAAIRELKEETGISDIDAIQLKSYGKYDRDPRTRIITTAFVTLIPEGSQKAEADDDASDAAWFDINLVDISENVTRLTLTSKEKEEVIAADIEKAYVNIAGIVGKEYKTIEKIGLAADHGEIILEAYEMIKSAL